MLITNKLSVSYALICVITALTVYANDSPHNTNISSDFSVTKSKETDREKQNTSIETIANTAPLRKTVLQYENSITELEKSGGAYDDRIGEELIGLGLAYRELGRFQKAIETFNRSLHIIRINQGLESTNQLAIMDLIIETNTAQSDWEALDQNYYYLYWLNRRIYKEKDPRQLLDVIARITGWHLNAYLTEYDPIPFKHLLQADKLFHDAVSIIEKHYGPNDPQLIEALNGISIANYHIASHIVNANSYDYEEIRSSTLNLKLGRSENVAEELLARQRFIESSHRARKKAMSRVTDIYANNSELPVAARARALVNLGDWYFIYDWRGNAFRNYKEAYHLLIDNNADPKDIQALFGKPTRIPSITISPPAPDKEDDEEHAIPFIKLSFDVTAYGKARSIKIIEESDPKDYGARKRARKHIKNSLFRPRFMDGGPVKTQGIVVRISGPILENGTDRKYVSYICDYYTADIDHYNAYSLKYLSTGITRTCFPSY